MQQSIFSYEQQIIDAGVRPYGPDYLRSRGRNIPSLFGLGRWTNIKLSPRTPAEQIEFLSKGDRRIFLTEENFLGALHEGNGKLALPIYREAGERISDLVSVLDGVDVRIFLAIRSPDTFLESAYSQTVYNGHFLEPDDYIAAHPFEQVNWATVVRAIAQVEGVKSVHVWRYEDYASVFKTLVRRMLRWRLGGVVEPIDRIVHEGLTDRAMAEIMADKAAGRPVNSAQTRRQFPMKDGYQKYRLYDDRARQEAQALYDVQVDAIKSMDKVEFYAV
ncbi:hypothetical protein BVC71_06175 [Marivivens niveibacter]|uniref:Sulfotransferase domain-containing protein n=1 Tax=Marivivens niveibacter TaxID=1930667 RepID=A0A251WY77_9RHOB|nr:hypothetical protein BVC71_06175 [Marivivens niveibacter]